jgi:5-methyltetrahydrofolate--homocysteine methyltransferase
LKGSGKSENQGAILAVVKTRVVLLDGAIGTMLMAEGLSGGEAPETWNLEKPDIVKSIHRQYFDAGSDIVLTNSFGGNRLKLGKKGRDRVAPLNGAAAQLARSVCPPGRFVGGDMGPSGELVAPVGNVSAEYLEEVFAEQAQALASGGVDLLVIQTMFSLQEAVAALRGARRNCRCPVFVSLTYERNDRGFFTLMGETPEVCTKTLEQEGADAVGANCTIESRDMIPLARILRKSTDLPVVVQPNAGKPFVKGGTTEYPQSPAEFAEDIWAMVEEGVNVVGGCCGTTPEFISAIQRRLSGS